MNIYVGNLPREATEEDLRTLFENYGRVDSVNLIKNKFTGLSRGFGFVGMQDGPGTAAAMAALNDREWKGRMLKVNEARPRRS